ncbi:MAG: alpha/beta hydrolase [Flavobacteriaceae bacterium]|nr:alpha/beta hydrolase [Flavobacteriaceae bacterium]
MKQTILFLLFLSHFTFLNAQQSDPVKPLVIGEVRTLYSDVLHEDRILNIYLPDNYNEEESYPILYLLDGSMNEDFMHITGLFQFFNLQFNMPEFIIVGIANVDRKRDFTYPTTLEDQKKDLPTSGHSEAFIRFIETELQPFVEKTYKTTNTRYLIGQSLGGLLATEILLKKPDLFSHYLIVSPSLWWNDQSLLKQAPELLKIQDNTSRYVYISVGGHEHPIMQRDAKNLYKDLKDSGKQRLTVVFNPMADENHATILHRSIYAALANLFPFKE